MAEQGAGAVGGPTHAMHEEHLTSIPIWLAVFTFVLYLGLGFGLMTDQEAAESPVLSVAGKAMLGVGLLGFVTMLFVWAHTDVVSWPTKEHHLGTVGGHRDVAFYGMIFFLATEVMLFAALFTYWFLSKYFADAWPPQGVPELPLGLTTVNTVLLLSSGATFHWGYLGLKKGAYGRFKVGLLLTLLLGTIFLILQVSEYLELFHHGLRLGTNAYGSAFFTLTGTHGFHVFFGLVLLLVVLWRAMRGQFNPDKYLFVEAAGMYWHFVDAVWIFLYATIYLELI